MKLTQIQPNLHKYEASAYQVYFSYETPVAFVLDGMTYISENVWTRTTGKHINKIKSICGEQLQIPHEEFKHILHM